MMVLTGAKWYNGKIRGLQKSPLVPTKANKETPMSIPKKDRHGDRTNMAFKSNWPEYNVLNHIKDRCLNPNSPAYKDYGGRGITVCDEWLASFDQFIADVGRRPSKHHTLDRIDNDKGYEPSNVRWTDRTVQAINRRKKSSNTSGVTGVTWHSRAGKWCADITVSGRRLSLGYYGVKADAIKARKQAEDKYFKPLLIN